MTQTTCDFDNENVAYLKGYLGEDKVEAFLRISQMDPKVRQEYLLSNPVDGTDYQRIKQHLEQMEGYGCNHWWLSKDQRRIGYYQLMHPRLLVPADQFKKSLETLIGKPIAPIEFGMNMEGLKKEALHAFFKEE